MIQDVVVNPFRERADVDEFSGIEAAVGRGGDVADVVATGTARGEAQFLNTRENLDDGAGLEFADLEISARREVDEAVAEIRRELGEAVALRGRDLAGRNADAEHKAVLRGGDVEEAVEFETVEVFGVGGLVGVGVREEAFPRVEGILFVFPTFLFAEVTEGGAMEGRLAGARRYGCSKIRRGGGGGGSGELAGGSRADEDAAGGDPSHEAGEVFLLPRREGLRQGGGGGCGGRDGHVAGLAGVVPDAGCVGLRM